MGKGCSSPSRITPNAPDSYAVLEIQPKTLPETKAPAVPSQLRRNAATGTVVLIPPERLARLKVDPFRLQQAGLHEYPIFDEEGGKAWREKHPASFAKFLHLAKRSRASVHISNLQAAVLLNDGGAAALGFPAGYALCISRCLQRERGETAEVCCDITLCPPHSANRPQPPPLPARGRLSFLLSSATKLQSRGGWAKARNPRARAR
jgi:hypothetical protein